MARPVLPAAHYTVGWICALSLELKASRAMFDEEHEDHPCEPHETNVYCLGRIGEHNVAMGCLPEGSIGTNAAAAFATEMLAKFPSMRYALMVGIGGGVPSETADIRLGDVVISKPVGKYGGVVQYDFGKTEAAGRVVDTGYLNRPSDILLKALSKLRSAESEHSQNMMSHIPPTAVRPSSDKLYESTYDHAEGDTCEGCDSTKTIPRQIRKLQVGIHYGLIASGNQVIKDGAARDRLSKRLGGVLCFEMEAAGIMNSIQCLVIRGVCDYADSHKNKVWQPYAAATAAAFSKELLSITPSQKTMDQIDIERSTRKNTEDDEIIRSLAFPEMNYRRDEAGRAYKDTCQWILQHEEYQRWMRQEDGLLWIKGKPGSGKSTLMAYLFRELEATLMDGRVTCLSFFFHGRGVRLQQSQVGMLRALLVRLFQSDPSIRGLFYEVFLDKKRYGTNWEWQTRELQRLLTTTILAAAQTRKVIIFIDALDEAGDDAHSVVEYLHELNDHIQSGKKSAKICIACRHYPVTATIPGHEIHVEKHNRNDIKAYVTAKLLFDGNTPQNQFNELKEKIVDKASGLFQWVILVVHIVTLAQRKGESLKDIHSMLDKLRPELKQLYEHIIHAIEQEERQRALLLMQWVCLAEEPLSVMQLRYAMAADEIDIALPQPYETASRNFVESDTRMEKMILSLSGGLLEIKYAKDTDGTNKSDEDSDLQPNPRDYVQPIHQSVKEFMSRSGLALLAGEEHAEPIKKFPKHAIAQGHNRLCRSCIRYLKWVHLNYPWPMKCLARNLVVLAPFILYCVKYWPIHAACSERDGVPQTGLVIEWKDDTIFNVWVSLCVHYGFQQEGCAQSGSTLLHVASGLNLFSVAQAVLEQGEDIESQDYSGNRPLHVAAHRGNLELATMLLDRGAELQPMNIDMAAPFDIAVANGHVEVMRMLIIRGNNVDHDILGKQSLYSAAEKGHLSMVSALLSNGADVNANGRRGTPLRAAVENGHFHIAQLLLNHGADVNFRGTRGNGSLSTALDSDQDRMFYLLLERAADINDIGAGGWCALVKAVSQNKVDVVRALLDRGANVNVKGPGGKTPLHYTESCVVAELLLAKGANPMAISTRGRTPVMDMAARVSGYERAREISEQPGLLQLFLKNTEVDLKLKDAEGNTILLCALSEAARSFYQGPYEDAYEVTIQLLLDKGSDIGERNKSGQTALHLAARAGLCKATSVLLRNGADPTILDFSDQTPLHCAAQSNSVTVLGLLLEYGADLSNKDDRHGFTPLAYATRRGNTEAVRLLLAQGPLSHLSEASMKSLIFNAVGSRRSADLLELYLDYCHIDLEWKESDGKTLSLHALDFGGSTSREECLRMTCLLLDRGANIAARDNFGQTALHILLHGVRHSVLPVQEAEALRVVRYVLDKGANPKAQDEKKRTPLHLAVSRGYASIVSLLLEKGADAQAVDTDGRQPLAYLSGGDNVEILGLLLKHGADINTRDKHGWTPLHQVVGEVRVTLLIRALLDAGVDVNARDHSGQTPLFQADSESAQALIRSGADPHARDNQRNTTLHTTVLRLFNTPVDLLILRGVDVNALNSLGQTPLHVSLEGGLDENSMTLLERGANPLLTDHSGQTALHFAAKGSTLDILRLILESGTMINQTDQKLRTALHYSCIHRNHNACIFLLDNGAAVEATDKDDRNSLHLLLIDWTDPQWREEGGSPKRPYGIHNTAEDTMHRLLNSGIDFNSKDRFGRSPLHYAAERGANKPVSLLLAKSVSIDERDRLGFTPLHLASRKGYQEIVELLIEAGADVFAKSGDRDALYMAALNGHYRVVDVLRSKMESLNTGGRDEGTRLYGREEQGERGEGQEDDESNGGRHGGNHDTTMGLDQARGRWLRAETYWYFLPLLCLTVFVAWSRFSIQAWML